MRDLLQPREDRPGSEETGDRPGESEGIVSRRLGGRSFKITQILSRERR